jgi:hypothetical protein
VRAQVSASCADFDSEVKPSRCMTYRFVGLCGYRKPLRELRTAHEPKQRRPNPTTKPHSQHNINVTIHLTSPHLRARRRVRSSLAHVRVNRDSRVALSSVSRNSSKVVAAGRTSSRSRDNDLRALGVELGRVGLVEGDDLVANEVVARGEGGGDGAGPFEVLEDVVGAPGGAREGRGGHAFLVDLLVRWLVR